jgi:hypothetical protein
MVTQKSRMMDFKIHDKLQDEKKVCVLKKQAGARGDDILIEKGRDDSQVGREH